MSLEFILTTVILVVASALELLISFFPLQIVSLLLSTFKAFLASGFLIIAKESSMATNGYINRDMNVSISTSLEESTVRDILIKICPSKRGKFVPKSERNMVKKVRLTLLSLFLCSTSCCVPEGMIWLRILFDLTNNAMYITIGTKLPAICEVAKLIVP